MDRCHERDALDRLIETVRTGQSRALVTRGDHGTDITVPLDRLAGQALDARCPVARGGRAVEDGGTQAAGSLPRCGPAREDARSPG
jgi:hypothetical protein